MRRSLLFDICVRIVGTSALVVSLYLLLAGHNQPGGGFVGGLVAGAAVALAFAAGGLDDVRRLVPVAPWTVLGGGLVVSTTAAVVPVLLGASVLQQGAAKAKLPVLGEVKLTSALAFDIGVYAVVVGVVLLAFEALGEEARPADSIGSGP